MTYIQFPWLGVASGELAFSDSFETYSNNTILLSTNTPPTSGLTWGIIDPGHEPVNCKVVNTLAYTGSQSLQFTYLAAPNTSPLDPYGRAEQRFSLPTAPKEIWIQFRLYVPSNYTHRTNYLNVVNNKLFYCDFGVTYPGGVRTVVGYIGFEMWRKDSSGSNYLTANFRKNGVNYGHTQDGTPLWTPNGPANTYNPFGNTALFLNPAVDNAAWHLIKIHLKIADASTANGVAQVWKDGVKILDLTGFDNSGSNPSTELFNEGYLMGFHNSGYATDTIFNIDDLVIQTAPL